MFLAHDEPRSLCRSAMRRLSNHNDEAPYAANKKDGAGIAASAARDVAVVGISCD
jgi:hypothetical protein